MEGLRFRARRRCCFSQRTATGLVCFFFFFLFLVLFEKIISVQPQFFYPCSFSTGVGGTCHDYDFAIGAPSMRAGIRARASVAVSSLVIRGDHRQQKGAHFASVGASSWRYAIQSLACPCLACSDSATLPLHPQRRQDH